MPDIESLIDYGRWSARELGLREYWNLLTRVDTASEALISIQANAALVLRPHSGRPSPDVVLVEASSLYSEGPDPAFLLPSEELNRSRDMFAAILTCILGQSSDATRIGIENLGSLLVTSPLNMKLTITFFLGSLTDGFVGLREKRFPARGEVLDWVELIRFRDLPRENVWELVLSVLQARF